MSKDVFVPEDKFNVMVEGIEKAEAALLSMASFIRDMSDCLEDMTNHYVELASSGWDPEEESEVMAAREMVSQAKSMLKGVPLDR